MKRNIPGVPRDTTQPQVLDPFRVPACNPRPTWKWSVLLIAIATGTWLILKALP